jgi:hypothetical protein
MRLILRLVGKITPRQLRVSPASPEVVGPTALDKPQRLAEFIAATSCPDLGGWPLEMWPGYRHCDVAAESEQANRSAAQARK